MPINVKQTTAQSVCFWMADSSDGKTGKTGLTLTVFLKKYGATSFTDISSGLTQREIGTGHYEVDLTTTHMNTVGLTSLRATASGADPADCPNMIEVVAFDKTDAIRGLSGTALPGVASGSAGAIPTTGTGANQIAVDGSGNAKADVNKWLAGTIPAVSVTGVPLVDAKYLLGTVFSTPTVAGIPNVNTKTWNDLATVELPLVPTTAGRKLDVSAGGEAGLDWANVGSPTTTVGLSGTTIKNSTDNATTEAAIKLKTDNLPGDPADASDVAAALAAIQADTDDIQSRLPAALTAGGKIKASTDEWNATAVATPTTAGVPRVDVKAIEANVITATSINADAITDAKVASDVTIASVTGAVGSVTGNVGGNVTGSVGSVVGAVGSVTGNVGGNVVGIVGSIGSGGITAATIADGAIDRATFAQDALDLFGERRRSTATAGGASTITLDGSASAVDDFYKNAVLVLVSGTGIGQFRTVASYVGATKVVTVDRAWSTTPDNTSVFEIFAAGGSVDAATVAGAVWNAARASYAVADSFGEGVNVADVLTAAANTIRDAILNFSHDSGLTIKGFFRRLDALAAGKASGLIGTVAKFYMRDGDTEAISAAQDTDAGTRGAANISGSES